MPAAAQTTDQCHLGPVSPSPDWCRIHHHSTGFHPFSMTPVSGNCEEQGGHKSNPSPGPRRLVKAPSRSTLSPRERA